MKLGWLGFLLFVITTVAVAETPTPAALWQWGGFVSSTVVRSRIQTDPEDYILLPSYPSLSRTRISGTSCSSAGTVGFMKLHRALALEAAHHTQVWLWFRCSQTAASASAGLSIWMITNVTLATEPLDLFLYHTEPHWERVGSLCESTELDPVQEVVALSCETGWIRHTYACLHSVSYETEPSWFPVEPHFVPLFLYEPAVSLGLLQFSESQLALPLCVTTVTEEGMYGQVCSADEVSHLCSVPLSLIQWQCIRGAIDFNSEQGCGDGLVDLLAHEQCDDGNLMNLDGCDDHCRIELHAQCQGSAPSTCRCAPGWRPSTLGCVTCEAGFFGPRCDPCPSYCQVPNGLCQDGLSGSGQCFCMRGFQGSTCRDCAHGFHAMDDRCMACSSSMCSPYGHCRGPGQACHCMSSDWVGAQCDVAAGEASSILTSNPMRPVVCPTDACGPHADCSISSQVVRMTDLNQPLPYYRCTCQTGWTGHQCQVCQTGYVGPLCEKCRACSTDSWLLCVELPLNTTQFGSQTIWKTSITATPYICPGDDSSSALYLDGSSTTDMAMVSGFSLPATPSWTAQEPRLDTQDHALFVSATRLTKAVMQELGGRYPRTQVWTLIRPLPRNLLNEPIHLAHLLYRSLELWMRVVPDANTLRIHCVGPELLACLTATNLLGPDLAVEPPLVFWNNASFQGQVNALATGDVSCSSMSCSNLCLTTLPNQKVYVRDALCPDLCICGDPLPLDATCAWNSAAAAEGGYGASSDAVPRSLRNSASLHQVDQIWKPQDPNEWDIHEATWVNRQSQGKIRIVTQKYT